MGINTRRCCSSRSAAKNLTAVTKSLVRTTRNKMMRNKIMKPTKQTKSTKGSKNEPKVESSPETIFKCSKCDASFFLKVELVQHAKQNHHKKTKKLNGINPRKMTSSAVNTVNYMETNVVKTEPENENGTVHEELVIKDEPAPEPHIVECYIVNENSENQENDPNFLDIFTVVEVKEVEIEEDELQKSEEDLKEEDETTSENEKNVMGSNNCKFCGRVFRHKKNIRPHVNRKHPDQVIVLIPDTSNYFNCEFCERKFKYKKNLNAHIRSKHPEAIVKPINDGERPFQCHLCDRKLKYKRNLNAHIRTKHLVRFQGDFTCNSCDRRFLFRKNLLVHLRNKHPSEIDQSPLHSCNVCGETFRTSSALRKHKSNEHPHQAPLSIFPKKCPLCDFFTSQKLPILRHFADIHNIAIDTKHVEFQEMQSFYDWKENLEKETNCKYSKISTGKFEDHTTMIFQCHRSGRSRKSKHVGGVVLNSSLSLKMNAYCPAQLYVVDYYTVIKVRYTSTHVGHDNEVTIKRAEPKNHLLMRTIKNMMQEEISQFPLESLQKEAPVHKETKQIIVKVSTKSKIDEKTRTYEMKTIDDWVNVHEADVIFYRKSGDTSLLDISDGELILIIMNEEQQSMMRKFGKKFVCVHTIHDRLKYAFTWTTVMVLDDHYEEYPVAFLVSNRTSAEIYQIFFQCVVNEVGPIQPEIFMGDKNEEMYWAWSEVIQPAEQFLFCSWQVREDWKINSLRIADENRRESVLNLLDKILVEKKYEVFEDELNSFIECSDEDIQTFREYFVENYMETIPSWAFCYRSDTHVEGKLTLESFRKIFTPSNNRETGQDLISVTEALLTLDEYHAARRKAKGAPVVKIVGLNGLLSMIEDNHKKAMNCGLETENVVKTEDGWLLTAKDTASGIEKAYKIRKNETVPCSDCKLMCPVCKVCFHRFSCSCLVGKDKLQMCEHIHFVGDKLRNEESA